MSKKQFNINNEIIAFIERKKVEGSNFSEAEVSTIQNYTGSGGLIKDGAKGRGVLYEYYTPIPIVGAMWSMVYKYGYTGSGKILEPSVGIGRFLRFVDPANNTVIAYEYSDSGNTVSFDIAKISYPWADIRSNYFESFFYDGNKRKKTIEADFDVVIGNPPYGKMTGYYSKAESNFFPSRTYDGYFLEAGISLLKQGGLLCFIMPSTYMSSMNKETEDWLNERAELVEAWRLPMSVFDFTQIGTDILLFKRK